MLSLRYVNSYVRFPETLTFLELYMVKHDAAGILPPTSPCIDEMASISFQVPLRGISSSPPVLVSFPRFDQQLTSLGLGELLTYPSRLWREEAAVHALESDSRGDGQSGYSLVGHAVAKRNLKGMTMAWDLWGQAATCMRIVRDSSDSVNACDRKNALLDILMPKGGLHSHELTI